MPSLQEIIHDLKHIQAAVDSIEIKGAENASTVLYAYNLCATLINQFENILNEAQEAQHAKEQEFALHEVTDNGVDCNTTPENT